MEKKTDILGIVMVLAVVVAIVAALALVTMMLWNWIMPNVMICDKINFWQSIGLIALFSLLTIDKSKLFSWLYE